MKAFICLALVACVAARSVDLDTYRLQKSLLKDELLTNKLSHRFQVPKKTFGLESQLETLNGLNTLGYPYKNLNWGQQHQVNSWDERRVSVYSFEDLAQTTLFQEYYEIPLFHQYMRQYPVVFRKYIESPLFQQFWTIPSFQQYFRNPVLFYKYIVPQVQIIAQAQEGVFSQEYPTYSHQTFGQENLVEELMNKNVYPESRREVVIGEYLNQLINGQHQYGNQYASQYGQYTQSPIVPYTRFGQQYYGRDATINHKFLLDKIYKTLFLNKPTVGEVTQVRTDVEIAPAHEKIVVEPITGQAEKVISEPKIVDVKVSEKVVPRTQVVSEVERHMYVKEALLQKLVHLQKISPEIYTVLKTLPLGHVKQVVRKIVGQYEYTTLVNEIVSQSPYVTRRDFEIEGIETPFYNREINTPFVTRDIQTPFYNREINTPFVTRDVQGLDAFYGQNNKYEHLIKELYNNELVGDRVVPTLRELLNTPTYAQQVRSLRNPLIDEIVRA